MRVSVKKDDPGYTKDAYKYKVFLDGVEIKHCFTADEERGKAFVEIIDYSVPMRQIHCLHGEIVLVKSD